MDTNERVKYLRVNLLHMRQIEFGNELGVGSTAISKIESGQRSLTEQMLLAIVRRWGVSEDWLRSGAGEPFPVAEEDERLQKAVSDILAGVTDPTRRELLSLLCSLSDEQLGAAAALLRWFVESWPEK